MSAYVMDECGSGAVSWCNLHGTINAINYINLHQFQLLIRALQNLTGMDLKSILI